MYVLGMLGQEPTERERRAAKIAHVLSHAVRSGDAEASDVLRILRHELRRLNTGTKPSIPVRSLAAQRVIQDYAVRGEDVPNNNSADALHADHVWRLTAEHLDATASVGEWIDLLRRLATVVCVTARENYALIRVERMTDGPAKYALAGVTFTTNDLAW